MRPYFVLSSYFLTHKRGKWFTGGRATAQARVRFRCLPTAKGTSFDSPGLQLSAVAKIEVGKVFFGGKFSFLNLVSDRGGIQIGKTSSSVSSWIA